MSDEIVSQSLASISTFMAAAGALGTGSFGLIDASKAICGGMSNPGFGFVRDEVQEIIGKEGGSGSGLSNAKIIATLRANWLNGVAKADQKAAAKSLIRMCITDDRIPQLARATGIKEDALREVSTLISNGDPLTQKHISLIGRFDAIVSSRLDLGYERADQFYRNWAKLAATLVAMVLAAVGGGILYSNANPSLPISGYFGSSRFLLSLLVGLISTPLAPVAKDLSTALSNAVTAVNAARR